MIQVKVIEEQPLTIKVVDKEPITVEVLGEFVSMPFNPYQGSYEVTPSQQQQILQTQNKVLTENIIIHPIPSNYGLITYNGFSLTVS